MAIRSLLCAAVIASVCTPCLADTVEVWREVEISIESGEILRAKWAESCLELGFGKPDALVWLPAKDARFFCDPFLNTVEIRLAGSPGAVEGHLTIIAFLVADPAKESEKSEDMRRAEVYFAGGTYCGFRIFAADQNVLKDHARCGIERS